MEERIEYQVLGTCGTGLTGGTIWRLEADMEERIEYRVLAPDSVAWFIQAALVADRKGNVHTRDLALAEAQRVAAERRLVEGPAAGSIAGWMGQVERRLIELENWRQEL